MFSVSPLEARHAQNRAKQQESTATLDISSPICLPLQAFALPPGQSQAKIVQQPKECPGKGESQQKTAGHRLKTCLYIVTVML